MIGKLERVPLREVWKNEATDFTPWLEGNIDVLNDVLEITLTSPERNQGAGAFVVDLVAEDDGGNRVIIENQLERSDHDHLGKLITYLTAFDAKTAIWIVANPRPEHVQAVAWLNEASSGNFYLIKVEAIRIEASPPAPLLTVIVAPSEGSKQIGETKKQLAEGRSNCRRFLDELLARAKETTSLHTGVSAGSTNWVGTGAGKSGLVFNYWARKHDASVHLDIDRGKDSEEQNKAIFDEFQRHKDDIEAKFGGSLDWQRLEGKQVCRIRKNIDVGGYADDEEWPQIHNAMIDAMIRLAKALQPHIDRIKIAPSPP